jgi:hypothetical protein
VAHRPPYALFVCVRFAGYLSYNLSFHLEGDEHFVRFSMAQEMDNFIAITCGIEKNNISILITIDYST